ncbi:MAG: hypothetical protein F6J92_23610 [Symploca sp. SIO1A3]|nr:hypothetical protein [Symploca sp. SIO1A3]
MSTKTRQIIEQLQSLNSTEVTELVKQIEEVFGVNIAVVKTFTYSPDPVNLTSSNLSELNKLDVVLTELPPRQEITLGDNGHNFFWVNNNLETVSDQVSWN